MIFRNALLRELVAMAVATFVVLLAIVITMLLVRLLGQAASGAITTSGVVALMGFATLNYLPVLFSLTLFISVLMALTRSYRDSEMVVWFSSGMSLTQWIRPVLTFAAPVVAIIALLSLVLSPWAVTNSEELRRQMDSRDDVSAVAPGVFRESRQAQRVYFVEEVSGSENLVANRSEEHTSELQSQSNLVCRLLLEKKKKKQKNKMKNKKKQSKKKKKNKKKCKET